MGVGGGGVGVGVGGGGWGVGGGAGVKLIVFSDNSWQSGRVIRAGGVPVPRYLYRRGQPTYLLYTIMEYTSFTLLNSIHEISVENV